MNLQKARREDVKLRIGISGASGFGKTYSALKLAYGLAGDWNKIAIIDTENGSASLYADLGPFNVLVLEAPFSPEHYIDAIKRCQEEAMEVIIIDSISHEWIGQGGCLQIHEKLGGRFQDWAKITPRHQAFIDAILNCSCHVITTARRKINYSLDIGSNGKAKVVKHGTKELTRDGFEYELTLNFELINENHLAKASKDRTGHFMNKPEFVINTATGKKLKSWCESEDNLSEVFSQIDTAQSRESLRKIYTKYPEHQLKIKEPIRSRLAQLETEGLTVAEALETNT